MKGVCLLIILITPINLQLIDFSEIVANLSEKLIGILNERNEIKNISTKCYDSMIYAYNATENRSLFYFTKLIFDSSRNINDLGIYPRCMKYKYNYSSDEQDVNSTFLMTLVDQMRYEDISSSSFFAKWYMFGICIAKGCNNNEYKDLTYALQMNLSNFMNLTENDTIQIFQVDNHLSNYDWSLWNILYLFPCFLILLQFIIVIFEWFPYSLLRRCFTHKVESGDLTDSMRGNNVRINKKKYIEFKSTFNITKNAIELFFYNTSSNINNDSGVNYIKGIQAISMILFIFGTEFFVALSNPVSIYSELNFIEFLGSYFYSVFFFGLRYAPRILFSCSGYTLFYKLMCFLDEKVEETIQKRTNRQVKEKIFEDNCNVDLQSNSKDQSIPNEDLLAHQLMHEDLKKEIREKSDVKVSFLFQFYLYQVPKYIVLIIFVLFFFYSLYPLLLIFKDIDPMWYYFKAIALVETDSINLLKAFTFINYFYLDEKVDEALLNYFWPIFNEIFFFLVTTLIIFLGYRFKTRIDIFLFGVTFIIIIGKIAIYCLNNRYYSSLYFYFYSYGKVLINPAFNYIYYIIGVWFGAINYNIQKDLDFFDLETQEKPFLFYPAMQVNYFKRKSVTHFFIIGFISFALIALFSILTPIIFSFSSVEELYKDQLNSFFVNPYLNIFFLIDIELVVIMLHFVVLGFYVKGNNRIISFFSNSIWAALSKMYYSYLLVMNPIFLYIYFQLESKIPFNLHNNIFFSLICGALIIIFSIIVYIGFELPYKKIMKLILEKSSEDDYSSYASGGGSISSKNSGGSDLVLWKKSSSSEN